MAKRARRRGPNDGGTIDQRPSGRWRLRVRKDGRQVTYGTYDTEDEVVRAQARWRLTGLLPADDPEGEVPVSVAVGGVRCDEWFERWQADKASRRSVVRVGGRRGGAASTGARDRAQWGPWWSPAIGQTLPHVVKRDDITGVLHALEEKGNAPNTIRTHFLMIRPFFNWLVAEKVLRATPVEGISLDVDPARDRVREIVVPDFLFMDILTTRFHSPTDRLIFELLLGTGGRRSEVAGIVVGDVDLARTKVWIREPLVDVEGRLVRVARPKGGQVRAVIVGPGLAALLRTHLAGLGRVPADHPLIVGPRGGLLRWNTYVGRVFRPAVHSAAVRWAALERRRLVNEEMPKAEATGRVLDEMAKLRRLTPHHLRHTAAALLWAAGASDLEVQLILGHADLETSKRLYAHLLSGAAESAAARVEELRKARR